MKIIISTPISQGFDSVAQAAPSNAFVVGCILLLTTSGFGVWGLLIYPKIANEEFKGKSAGNNHFLSSLSPSILTIKEIKYKQNIVGHLPASFLSSKERASTGVEKELLEIDHMKNDHLANLLTRTGSKRSVNNANYLSSCPFNNNNNKDRHEYSRLRVRL